MSLGFGRFCGGYGGVSPWARAMPRCSMEDCMPGPDGMLYCVNFEGGTSGGPPEVQNARLINLIGGLLLVGIGVYDLWSNWDLIRIYLT